LVRKSASGLQEKAITPCRSSERQVK